MYLYSHGRLFFITLSTIVKHYFYWKSILFYFRWDNWKKARTICSVTYLVDLLYSLPIFIWCLDLCVAIFSAYLLLVNPSACKCCSITKPPLYFFTNSFIFIFRLQKISSRVYNFFFFFLLYMVPDPLSGASKRIWLGRISGHHVYCLRLTASMAQW